MDTFVISEKREVLKNTLIEICRRAESDRKLFDATKERGFWKRVLSNNTRDLAKTGMAQQELFDKLQQAVQGLMEVVQDGQERERQFAGILEDLRAFGDQAIGEFKDDISKVVRKLFKEDKKIEMLRSGARSDEASKKCAHGIVSALGSADLDGKEIVEIVQKAVTECFTKKSILLRDEDKCTIIAGLKDQGAKIVEVDLGRGMEKKHIDDICEQILDGVMSEGSRYSKFRDELIGFIDDFNRHRKDVDPSGEKIEQLLKVGQRLRESQFEVALIGQFQGGKSTTFNALCGGREISPRGINGGGVKTSAAVVMAQNIADGETRNGMCEWAEISWMSVDELCRRIRDAVVDLPKRDYTLKELRKEVDRLWEELTNVRDEDGEHNNRKDMLQVASLQLRVLESGEYEKFSRKQIVPIDEFQEYVRFPIDWDDRWGQGEGNLAEQNFSISECLFSCVSSVLVRLHSQCLERLGCRITDCPGLFVNQWDTARAMEVMQRSNAIWFLCDGERAFAEDVVDILGQIRKHGADWVKKCFFTLNVKHPSSSTRTIVQSNLAKIKDAGFCVKNIFCYNALVALRLQQIKSIGLNKLSIHDKKCLALESRSRCESEKAAMERINKATRKELVLAIRELLLDTLHNTKDHDLYDSGMTDEEVINAIEPVGGMRDVVTRLEKYLVVNKASSILVDNGSEACCSVLVCLQTTLKEVERDAQKKLDEASSEWEEAKKRLDAFKRDALANFGFLLTKTDVDAKFLTDFYDMEEAKIVKEVKALVLAETKKKWEHCSFSRSVEKQVAASMKEQFPTTFKAHLQSYLNTINGAHPVNQIYNADILSEVHRVWDGLSASWNEVEKEVPKLQGLKPDDSDVELSCNAWDVEFQSKFDLPVMWWETFRNAGNWLMNKIVNIDRVTTEKKLESVINEDKVIENIIESVKVSAHTTEFLKSMFAKVRTNTFGNIKASLDASSLKLAGNEQVAMARLNAKNKDREAVAEKAKNLRETIIDPKLEALSNFKSRVRQVYGE